MVDMDNLSITILREAVYFLEICQEQVFNGKIPTDTYFSLSDFKLKFIKNILDKTFKFGIIDNELDSRLQHVFQNDIYIRNRVIADNIPYTPTNSYMA